MAPMWRLFGGISDEGLTLLLPRARHLLRAKQRLALALLASVPRGVSQDLLVLGHGFDSDIIAELVHAGLARSRREIVEAGGPPIEIVRITITDAGRRAIEVDRPPPVATIRDMTVDARHRRAA